MTTQDRRGFTLIELLVVIAIIGLLSSIVLSSLNIARAKAQDAKRTEDLKQLSNAVELRYSNAGNYPSSAGWFSNAGHGGLDAALTPTYIPVIPDDPIKSGSYMYMYWREDYAIGTYCSGATGRGADHYGFYAHLSNPTAAQLATMSSSFDQCVQTKWGMNYRVGN